MKYENPVMSIDGKRICFSIPGEVTDGFLSQIAMFRIALRQCPAPTCDARIIAYLGCDGDVNIPERWRKHLEGVDIRLVRMPGDPYGYVAQAKKRFTENDPSLDYVILCDADTLILGDITEAIGRLADGAPVAGVIAHNPPPRYNNEDWREISTALNGSPVELPYHYTLLPPAPSTTPDPLRSPFYLNHGFLAFRADALREFDKPFSQMRDAVAGLIERPNFAGQIGLSLTMQTLGWYGAPLSMRYNYPNDDKALRLHGYEEQEIRVLHYLRENKYRRNELFSKEAVFRSFMAERPEDADRVVFDAIMRLTKGQYPF